MQSYLASLLTALLLVLLTPLGDRPNAELDLIRKRLRTEVLASFVDETQVAAWVAALQQDGSWPDINYEDLSRTGYENRLHVSRLLQMGLAYKKPGSAHFAQAKLKQAIGSAIDFWTAHDFIAGNWHTNEIGNPTQWTRFLLLMDGELSENQIREVARMARRANLDAWGARPGGDLIKIAGIMAEMALYERDEPGLKKALAAMNSQIAIANGQGIQPDLSFHHRTDRVTSVLSYGTGYAGAFAEWAARLAGTGFQFPDASMKLLIDYYLDGICQTMVHGWYKDPGAINRSMSRRASLNPIGADIPQNLLQASSYRKPELEKIVGIRTGARKPDLSSNRFFWHSEYLSHQRPGYFTSVRMFSDRNNNMESPHNEESLKHHHYADGGNFLSRTGKEYFDIFPVWDWQKIPGTTVVQKPALPHWRDIVRRGTTDFVGGVSDGTYGAATFDFASPHDPLTAHKSWFFFDKEYVCLGAAIRSDSEHPVATTLNQCLLNGAVTVKTKRGASNPPAGEHQLKEVSWVHHDGVAYLFPGPAAISLRNKAHSGTWQSIANSASVRNAAPVQKDVFTLWLDHGIRPQAAAYEYMVVPGIEAGEIAQYEKKSPLITLANTPVMQAVQHRELNLTQAVFYQAGELEIAKGLTFSAPLPGLVMVQTDGRNIQKITVADPTRKLRSYSLTLTARLEGAGKHWKAVWNEAKGHSELHFDLPGEGMAGQSVVLDVNEKQAPGAPVTALPANHQGETGAEHFVGEFYGGGVVIWVDETGKHGLIASIGDQSTGIPWRNGPSEKAKHFGDHGDRVINARGDGIGAGQMNTLLIIAQQTEDDYAGNFAAKVCATCTTEGYGDWYLPSKSELKLMYQAREKIGGFGSEHYWSSTEYNVGFAWGQSFHTYSGEYAITKGSRSAVRCIRKF